MNKKNNILDTTFFPFGENAGRQKGLGLKICGMKYPDNICEVATLQPDYLGFIFYKKSPRYFDGVIPKLPENIKSVGVFVDATINDIVSKVEQYNLQMVQLHGNESPEFCKKLLSCLVERVTSSTVEKRDLKLIKVFSIDDHFNFNNLQPYESICDYFLFDTKGKLPGGNGYKFNWNVLKNYPSSKPYFLSGGIGLNDIETLKAFLQEPTSRYCHAIDINSQFEVEAGLKDIDKLKELKKLLT